MVCGHSVIATRIVVPISSAKLTVIVSLVSVATPSGLTLGHDARRDNEWHHIASGLVVGVQLPCSGLHR
jgi:hypothetical protein